ncbi:MAG: hypothetical protein Q7R52_00950 [archaeon]|nr:hypothetical protein [archaeon]
MRFILILVSFLIIGALFIISNNNLEMYKQENINTFFTLYIQWGGHILDNAKEVSGNAVRLDWFPTNSTIK